MKHRHRDNSAQIKDLPEAALCVWFHKGEPRRVIMRHRHKNENGAVKQARCSRRELNVKAVCLTAHTISACCVHIFTFTDRDKKTYISSP